jgi:hypothetical protein
MDTGRSTAERTHGRDTGTAADTLRTAEAVAPGLLAERVIGTSHEVG